VIGTRAAAYVRLTAVVVALIGNAIGLVSGYFVAWITSLLMRLADVALGIPSCLRHSDGGSSGPAQQRHPRIACCSGEHRAGDPPQVLTVRERAFVESARVTGA